MPKLFISAQNYQRIKYTPKNKSKYNAVRCESNGIKFPSKLERNYYEHLLQKHKDKKILYFLRQTRFDLPGNVAYLCDFTVFELDGSVTFVDTKGKDTPMSIMKRKTVENIYS